MCHAADRVEPKHFTWPANPCCLDEQAPQFTVKSTESISLEIDLLHILMTHVFSGLLLASFTLLGVQLNKNLSFEEALGLETHGKSEEWTISLSVVCSD